MPYKDPDKQREAVRKSYRKHRAERNLACQEYYLQNPLRKLSWGRAWRAAHPEQVREINRRGRIKNRDKRLKSGREYARKNRPKINAHRRMRMATDINYRITAALRTRFHSLVIRGKKSDKTLVLLGCSVDSFKLYIESKFDVGMSWENYASVWELDHIVPCGIFDLTKAEQQQVCFHFSNFQPLFKADNRRKWMKLDYEPMPTPTPTP